MVAWSIMFIFPVVLGASQVTACLMPLPRFNPYFPLRVLPLSRIWITVGFLVLLLQDIKYMDEFIKPSWHFRHQALVQYCFDSVSGSCSLMTTHLMKGCCGQLSHNWRLYHLERLTREIQKHDSLQTFCKSFLKTSTFSGHTAFAQYRSPPYSETKYSKSSKPTVPKPLAQAA